MPSVIKSVSFDPAGALKLARFWAVLGSEVDEDLTIDKAFVEDGPGGPNIWFTRVPEPKRARNGRTSTCAPGAMGDEVARLKRLGTCVAHHYPDHTAMTDPEGNESA